MGRHVDRVPAERLIRYYAPRAPERVQEVKINRRDLGFATAEDAMTGAGELILGTVFLIYTLVQALIAGVSWIVRHIRGRT